MTATTATTSRFQQLIQKNQAVLSTRRKAINAIMGNDQQLRDLHTMVAEASA